MTEPTPPARPPLRVVILTTGNLGIKLARRLKSVNLVSVELLGVISTPWRRKKRTAGQRVRHIVKTQGVLGLGTVAMAKFGSRLRLRETVGTREGRVMDAVPQWRFGDFHDEGCLETLRMLKPQLGVLAGTYILRDEVFSAPSSGCINLHSGEAPRYRGAAPAFWELYNGESHVGITIHRVSAELDAGPILKRERFPLEAAPEGDPMQYLKEYRTNVLGPNGMRMLLEVIEELSTGTAVEVEQDAAQARTYKSPDYKAIKELRRRVKRRREH